MAATDQTYRNQRTLDIVFAVSCVLMLLSVLWMFWQDYHREYKGVQRTFRDVETARNERLALELLPDPGVVDQKREAVTKARKDLEDAKKGVAAEDRRLTADRTIQDNEYRTIKADFDSKTSYRNITAEHLGKADNPADRKRLQDELDHQDKELLELGARLADAQAKLDAIDQEYKEKVTEKLRPAKEQLTSAEDELKKITAVFDRYAKAAAQKRWKFGDSFRNLPILDAFAAPTKINQVTLPDLTIDYGGFKDVPRYDRCITCHLGIERANLSKDDLRALNSVPEGMADKLARARDMLRKREDSGENLGFDVGDFPKDVRKLSLTEGQITQYAAHPRLDLFVDANSAHPVEKFGCTTCHAGQGSATDFLLAAHAPADSRQEKQWKKEYGWHGTHDWEFPMQSSRFQESSCAKCHYDMAELIRHGSKEEAPKLLRGYNLVREFGCFGCHEISGIKSGRAVGPDLRAEPSPALDYLTAAEQDRAKSDPLNPPGTLRKVGPSLRRIAEKTNQEWARKWIRAPRNFRPDTRMPHFYGLSNNNDEALQGTDQGAFPDTEIHSIAHYLFEESRKNLDGKDTIRAHLIKRVGELQGELVKVPLGEKDWKELLELSRRLGDVALLSAPANSGEINRALQEQRQYQDRLEELQKKRQTLRNKKEQEDLNAEEVEEIKQATTGLKAVTERLVDAGKPVPLAKQLVDEHGAAVKLPASAGDKDRQKHLDNGRRLFTERGCLACHSHSGTAKAAKDFPAVDGKAEFGPNLSRIAAKISPEVGGKGTEAARRWLVQWVMNPNVYHPRTRMPITHLSPEDAGDVADWLLSQKVEDWDQKDPKEPGLAELINLARVYLGRVQGVTRQDLDAILPRPTEAGAQYIGITEKHMDRLRLPADADERRLSVIGEKVPDEQKQKEAAANLKWYIGRKAINRLGCFGCHDVPGYETAKPIGTALNDWGRKDPARIAFEDGAIYVKDHYNIVEARNDDKDPKKPAADWHDARGENGQVKRPFEKFFYDQLEEQHREGFLHLKLEEPRSYDYHRVRTWDDRLRMPQFRFARTRRQEGEEDAAFKARQELEEAEAREAVMTFILGLVAEPVPFKYVYKPNRDRQAEVKGREVLDKFNCAGCHQVRPGVYEFKPTDDTLKLLEASYNTAKSEFASDYHFSNHNAWVGSAPPAPDRMIAFATDPVEEKVTVGDEVEPRDVLSVRLTDALRFTDSGGVVRDIPAGSKLHLPPDVPGKPKSVTYRSDTFGGTFVYLLKDYVMKKYGRKEDETRGSLPPPLVREGERVQPNWLFGFLLNPPPIRPEKFMLLRMPKFNMSEGEARALVNYFAAVSRRTNPGAGVTAEYLTIPEQNDRYLRRQTQEYIERLRRKGKAENKDLVKGRAEAMAPIWAAYQKKELAAAEAAADLAKLAVEGAKKAKNPDPAQTAEKQKAADAAAARVKELKEQLDKKDDSALRKRWETREAYLSDAYRLMLNPELCVKCHSIGGVSAGQEQGPNLELAATRLRPEWVEKWVANPKRMFTYSPVMPQNFPRDKIGFQESFVADSPIEQVRAARDFLMDLPKLSDLPGNQARAPAGGETK